MNSNCSRLGRRKIGKNEKLWNERNHADADAEKRLCAAESAAVAVSCAPCESCRRIVISSDKEKCNKESKQ